MKNDESSKKGHREIETSTEWTSVFAFALQENMQNIIENELRSRNTKNIACELKSATRHTEQQQKKRKSEKNEKSKTKQSPGSQTSFWASQKKQEKKTKNETLTKTHETHTKHQFVRYSRKVIPENEKPVGLRRRWLNGWRASADAKMRKKTR